MTIPKVYNSGEAGLLSIALHPNYATNRRFFAYFSQTLADHPVACTAANAAVTCGPNIACTSNLCGGNHVSVINEYTAVNATTALPTSAREVRT